MSAAKTGKVKKESGWNTSPDTTKRCEKKHKHSADENETTTLIPRSTRKISHKQLLLLQGS
jgi:hypothetical protein